MANFTYVIKKSKVKGHFIKRSGKMVYIKPHYDKRQKQAELISEAKKQRVKPLEEKKIKTDELVNYIIYSLKLIQELPPREQSRLRKFVHSCKSILREVGYLDETLDFLLEVPDVIPKDISEENLKVIQSIYQNISTAKTDTKSNNMKEKLTRMLGYLQEVNTSSI